MPSLYPASGHPTLSPQDFVTKWRNVTTNERASAQSHFNDLCRLLGQPTPLDADPQAEHFAVARDCGHKITLFLRALAQMVEASASSSSKRLKSLVVNRCACRVTLFLTSLGTIGVG